eukprot:CAMPEP_0197832016 /NCGR_PEP_ID=MMETSP1437-20131217/12903_1 /TAXON_ID=49252 ORGANISM="Eucampia antarctica, Strain CCMP1452" /NCGR_SAMPLE_ID=MMETSP1437 /ASSEMBLY_ACC=CAM_ASM_001096 /LENGTH=308 /DNA_ID=CAMNT_0043435177 /DNA_START=62 /DNA_END=988 /DNA_ORIENTATION=-
MKTHLLNISILILGTQAKSREFPTLLRDSQDDMMVSTDTISGLAGIEAQILELEDKYETQPLADGNKYESLENNSKQCAIAYSCVKKSENVTEKPSSFAHWGIFLPGWILAYTIFIYFSWKEKKYVGPPANFFFGRILIDITVAANQNFCAETVFSVLDVFLFVFFCVYEFPKQKIWFVGMGLSMLMLMKYFLVFMHEETTGYVTSQLFVEVPMSVAFLFELSYKPERAKNQWTTTVAGIGRLGSIGAFWNMFHLISDEFSFMNSTYLIVIVWNLLYVGVSLSLHFYPPKKQESVAEESEDKALLTVF